MICALLNRAPSRVSLASGACQKLGVLGSQPASNTEQMVAEIGPVAWFHLLWSFAREVAFLSPQTLRIPRFAPTSKPPHCDPLADLFNSGGNLWHTPFAEKTCDCGNGARTCFAHHSAHFEVFAHRVYLSS